jgi:hypothetical protein
MMQVTGTAGRGDYLHESEESLIFYDQEVWSLHQILYR